MALGAGLAVGANLFCCCQSFESVAAGSALFWLGNYLDLPFALLFVAICLSTIFAPFPHQALCQALLALSMVSCVYAVANSLRSPEDLARLVNFQAGLGAVVESLGLGQTLLPELARLQQVAELGVNLGFDFSNIELRNWAPFGHQNYTVGYLLLVMPLFGVKALQGSNKMSF